MLASSEKHDGATIICHRQDRQLQLAYRFLLLLAVHGPYFSTSHRHCTILATSGVAMVEVLILRMGPRGPPITCLYAPTGPGSEVGSS